jgi:hypothetical protein
MQPFKVMGCQPTYAARSGVYARRPTLETALNPRSRPARAAATKRPVEQVTPAPQTSQY